MKLYGRNRFIDRRRELVVSVAILVSVLGCAVLFFLWVMDRLP